MNNDRPVFTVSDINQYIKAVLSNDENLKLIYVKGEISNFKMASNGHFYFSLKDDKSLIGAMMFSNYASKCNFKPENGQEVVVFGSIDAYVGRGTYQIIVYQMEEVGAGAQLLELEKLKKKLLEEGLFDESRKRKIICLILNVDIQLLIFTSSIALFKGKMPLRNCSKPSN